jgi:hypothetical protein
MQRECHGGSFNLLESGFACLLQSLQYGDFLDLGVNGDEGLGADEVIFLLVRPWECFADADFA